LSRGYNCLAVAMAICRLTWQNSLQWGCFYRREGHTLVVGAGARTRALYGCEERRGGAQACDAYGVDMRLIAEISVQEYGGQCDICTEGILHRLALSYLYAVARAHGLKPIVEEGTYKGLKYIIIAASEAGLQEATRAMEGEIEVVCRRVGICNK